MSPPIEEKKRRIYKGVQISPELDEQRRLFHKLAMRISRHGDPTIILKKKKNVTTSHKKRVAKAWYEKKKLERLLTKGA